MAEFKGYLFGTVNEDNTLKTKFPNEYIQIDTYSTLPNSREELKAIRDDNTRNLTRVTASGTKSSFSFSTMDGLNKSDIEKILNFFTSAESDNLQRKIKLIYWNMEELRYKVSEFYRPDITYTLATISENDFECDEFEISLIEY